MENRFGHDFSRVRIHDDVAAHEAAASLGARAYTLGSDIIFARGEYRPGTRAGRGVLAHELTHVVQQGGRAARVAAMNLGPTSGPAEREAETARSAIERDRSLPGVRVRSAGDIQRLPGSAAGGCGVCYGAEGLKAVGQAAHVIIEAAMVAQYAFLVPEFDVPNLLPGPATKGIPDLMEFTGPESVAIGEIKPNSPTGIAAGEAELNTYESQLVALGMNVTRLNLPPPLAPLPFPTGAMPSGACPATHALYVDAPKNGLYTYWCQPDFKELRPRCKCKDTKKPPPPPVPVTEDVKETDPAREKKDVKERGWKPDEILVPIGVATAVALGVAARKKLASGALAKKAAGRAFVYAEAAAALALIIFYSDRLEAAPGGSDEMAMEALLRAMTEKGVPLPPDLAERIKSDPELKAIMEKAARSGNFEESRSEALKKMTTLINDNPEQFSDEDLRILMTAAQSPGAAGKARGKAKDPTVESLKKTIERARAGKASPDAAGQKEGEAKGGAEGKGEGGEGKAKGREGEGGPGVEPATKPPKDVPKTKYPALSADVQKALDAAPPAVRFVLQQMLGHTKGGPKLDDVAVRRFLATVPADLTDAEASKLTKNLLSARGKTLDEIMLSLAHAVQAVRAPPSKTKPSDPSKPAPTDDPSAEKVTKKKTEKKTPARSDKTKGPKAEKRAKGKEKKDVWEEARRNMIRILRKWEGWEAIAPEGNRYIPVGEGTSFENVGSEFMIAFIQQRKGAGGTSVRSIGFFYARVKSKSGRTVVLDITGGGPVIADDGTDTGREIGAFTEGTSQSITLLEGGAE